MTYAKFNCLKKNCLIIELCVNKWLMFNWIVSDRLQYLELSNFIDSRLKIIYIYLIYMYKENLA